MVICISFQEDLKCKNFLEAILINLHTLYTDSRKKKIQ